MLRTGLAARRASITYPSLSEVARVARDASAPTYGACVRCPVRGALAGEGAKRPSRVRWRLADGARVPSVRLAAGPIRARGPSAARLPKPSGFDAPTPVWGISWIRLAPCRMLWLTYLQNSNI